VIDPTSVLIAIAVLTLVVPVIFLIVLAIAAVRRNRDQPVGDRLTSSLALLGGVTLGLFALVGSTDLLTDLPILVAAALFVLREWRRGHRRRAGWILAGSALPWTLLWAFYLAISAASIETFDMRSIWLALVGGLIPVVIGLVLVRRGDPAPPAPDLSAPAGQPGSRSFGTISAAIRAPGFIGPIGLSEVAALVAYVATWVVASFLVPAAMPRLVAIAIPALVASLLATEAYIRAMPSRSRLAFEAFSWLGEWELHRLGMSPLRVPTTAGAARRWLASHPETPELLGFRAEILALAGQYQDARAAAERLPDSTPLERWERAEALDSIDWRSGGDGDQGGLEAAAAELLPRDGDDRLRAEVALATAEVRRRMADGRSEPGDAADPLVAVRAQLGARADGQVGRALRRRLFLMFAIASLALGTLFELLAPGGQPLF